MLRFACCKVNFFFEREAQGDVFVNCTVRHAGETLETKIDQDGVTNGGPGTVVAMGCIGWTSDGACTMHARNCAQPI